MELAEITLDSIQKLKKKVAIKLSTLVQSLGKQIDNLLCLATSLAEPICSTSPM